MSLPKIDIFSLILEIIGAFIAWAFKGFKGKLMDEISGPYESSRKSWRNLIISSIFVFVVASIVVSIQKKNEKNKEEKKGITIIKTE
jgi:hypothetical protein